MGGFLYHWPSLVERKPQHLEWQRAQCLMHKVVEAFFNWLEEFFQKIRLTQATDDETGFCTAVASKSVLTRRRAQDVHKMSGGSGKEFTVLGMYV